MGIGGAIALSVFLAWKFGLFNAIDRVLQQSLSWIESLGILAPIAYIILYILTSVFLISGAILTLGAGFIFGVVRGFILVSVASTLAGTVAFAIGRYWARGWVEKQIEQQPKFRALDAAVAREGWKIVGLARLSPLFPFVFLNYAFGVTRVSFRDYILASWIGMMPGTLLYVYLGYLPKIAAEGSADKLKLILNIVGLIATLAVTIYVTKIARQALDREIESGEPKN
nr:TVP38/TMEM64 family protein [Oscillatoria sp. FACHB-1406]